MGFYFLVVFIILVVDWGFFLLYCEVLDVVLFLELVDVFGVVEVLVLGLIVGRVDGVDGFVFLGVGFFWFIGFFV